MHVTVTQRSKELLVKKRMNDKKCALPKRNQNRIIKHKHNTSRGKPGQLIAQNAERRTRI